MSCRFRSTSSRSSVRDLADDIVRPQDVLTPVVDLAVNEVDHTAESVFPTQGNLDRQRLGRHPRPQHEDRPFRVGPDPVHLVDEHDPRHPVLVGLAPHCLGLRFDAANSTQYGYRAVEHPQGALDLRGEIHVTGRINDIDTVVTPGARRRGRGDGDPAFLLLDHPIHHGRSVVHLAHLVGHTRIEQDPLGRGRLAGVDMGHDTDVPYSLDRV